MKSSQRTYKSAHKAVFDGDFAKVKKLISLFGTYSSQKGYNLLCLATERNHTQISKFLLSNGCEVNLNPPDQPCTNTPLHFAVANNNPELVIMLLEAGANISAKGTNDKTPLHIGVEINDISVCKFLIKMGANVETISDKNETPLLVAAAYGHFEIVELLLKHKANINAQRSDNKTALFISVEQRNWALFQKLLECGAEINIKNKQGKEVTPLHIAASDSSMMPFVKVLLKYDLIHVQNLEEKTALHIAIENKNWDIVNLLVRSNARLNVCDNFGQTPVHLLVENGDFIVVDNVLSYGHGHMYETPLRTECKLGLRPLDVAVKYKKNDIANLLLKYGAKTSKVLNGRRTPLFFAVQSGFSVLVDKVLNDPPDIASKGNRLAFYASLNKPELAEKFVKYGFTVIPEDATDEEIIRYALATGDINVLKELVRYGFNPKTSFFLNTNKTSLHLAAMFRQEKVAKFLIDCGVNVNAKDSDKKTAIYYAAEKGGIEVIRLLVNHGADASEFPKVIHTSVLHGAVDIVKILLNRGVDPNALDSRGETPLHSVYNGRDEETQTAIAELLISRGANVNALEGIPSWKHPDDDFDIFRNLNGSALHQSVQAGFNKLSETLLRYNADINIRNFYLETPLHISVRENDTAMTHMLLQKGADLEAKTKFGFTPLHMAVYFNRPQIVEILLNAGANINAKDNKGRSSLHVAATYASKRDHNIDMAQCGLYRWRRRVISLITKLSNNNSVVSLLFTRGANVDSVDNEGKSPLHIASEKNFADFVIQLLKKGAKIDLKDHKGRTPLFVAAEKKKHTMVKILLENGASNDVVDNEGNSVLLGACKKEKNAKVIALLLKNCLNIDHLNCKGQTPLLIALRTGRPYIVDLLLKHGANINASPAIRLRNLMFSARFNYTLNRTYDFNRLLKADDDYALFDYGRPLAAKVLERHIFKMRIFGMHILCRQKLAPNSMNLSKKFKIDYKKEYARLNATPIGKSKVTYLKFLKSSLPQLLVILRKENIYKTLQNEKYKTLFPIFESLISCHFYQGKTMLQLFKNVTLKWHGIFPALPEECIGEILSYFKKNELFDLYTSLCDIRVSMGLG